MTLILNVRNKINQKGRVNLLIVKAFFRIISSYLIQCNLTGIMMFVSKINHIYKICIQQKKKEKSRNCTQYFILVPHKIIGNLVLRDGPEIFTT